MIKHVGFPFSVFNTLYQACVSSILDYGGEIFGYNSYNSTLKIHLRAARSFLGVTKTTAIPGILSELNLLVPQYRTQIKMIRQFHRISKMTNNRLTRKIFEWDKTIANEGHFTWYFEVKDIFKSNNLENSFEASTLFDLKDIVDKVQSSMLGSQQNSLKIQCEAMPKLRVFKTFKEFDTTPSYITKPMSFIQRKFISKLRLGCLEIRMETGRYARPRLPAEARLCQVCENENQEVEDEFHFLSQ